MNPNFSFPTFGTCLKYNAIDMSSAVKFYWCRRNAILAVSAFSRLVKLITGLRKSKSLLLWSLRATARNKEHRKSKQNIRNTSIPNEDLDQNPVSCTKGTSSKRKVVEREIGHGALFLAPERQTCFR